MKKLLERKDLLIAEMAEMLDRAEAETRALDIEAYEAHEKELAALNATIEKLETRDKGEIIMDKKEMETRDYAEELRVMTTETNGASIPTTIATQIVEELERISPVFNEAPRYNTPGKLEFLINTNNVEAEILGEVDTLTDTNLSDFKKVILDAKRVGLCVPVSKQLLLSSPQITVDFLVKELAKGYGRICEKQMFKADGTAKSFTSGLLKSKNVITGAVSIDTVKSLVIKMHHSLIGGAKLYMNLATFEALSLLKDETGNYYVQLASSLVGEEPQYRIFGKEIVVTEALEADVIVFANVAEAMRVKLNQDMQVTALTDSVYAKAGQVGVMIDAYLDMALVNEQAVYILKKATK